MTDKTKKIIKYSVLILLGILLLVYIITSLLYKAGDTHSIPTPLDPYFLKVGGIFIAYKSTKVHEEISQAENTLKTLGADIIDIVEIEKIPIRR